jgi:hypothetical protein
VKKIIKIKIKYTKKEECRKGRKLAWRGMAFCFCFCLGGVELGWIGTGRDGTVHACMDFGLERRTKLFYGQGAAFWFPMIEL